MIVPIEEFVSSVLTPGLDAWVPRDKRSGQSQSFVTDSPTLVSRCLVRPCFTNEKVREVDRKLNSSLAEISERNNATSPSAASGGGGSGGGSGGSQIRAKTRTTIPSVRGTLEGWGMIVYACPRGDGGCRGWQRD